MSTSDISTWTYGAELELSDLDQRRGLPEGFRWDTRDVTMVNSNGVAVDPKGKSYPFGGEINTPPTKTIKGQVARFKEVLAHHPDATINHRSNLHLHIRVPGLEDNLKALKKIQRYTYANREYLSILEPIPVPDREKYSNDEEYQGAVRRMNRRKVSHQCAITPERYKAQQAANTVEEFFAAEAPKKKDGTPMFHLAPRLAVNLRQLKETKTIEFRHFPGTLDPEEFRSCLQWCRDFLHAALNNGPSTLELLRTKTYTIPKFKPYVHWREVLYRNTVHDGTLKRAVIEENIKKITDKVWSKKNLPTDPSLQAKVPKLPVVPDPADALKGLTAGKSVKDYPQGTPSVIFVRGTSGTGKSTLIYNLLCNDYGFKPIEQFNNPKLRKDHKYGYYSKRLNCFIVGSYHTPTGGCDALTSVDEVFARIQYGLSKGYHVIAEGLMISGLCSRQIELSKSNPVRLYVLATPMATSIERVKKRRAARGDERDFNPLNTLKKGQAVISSSRTLAPHVTTLRVEPNDVAYKRIAHLLGAETKHPFEPDIFTRLGHKLAVGKPKTNLFKKPKSK